jgi:hypothetical protein
MLRAKEFCQKDDLDELVNFELLNNNNSERQFNEFRKRFSKDDLPVETTKDSMIERLRSIFKKSIFQTEKDLAMVSTGV